MRKFLLHLLYVSIPFLGLIVSFLILDPFKIIYHYDNYIDNSNVVPNRDYVSTQYFIDNYKSYNYNSFMFGSSRTAGIYIDDWKKYLPNNSSPYSFDASGESIYGIWKKVRLLDSLHVPINNALLLICPTTTFQQEDNVYTYIGIKHPSLSNEYVKFYKIHLEAYLHPNFFIPYFDYLLFKKYKPYMEGVIDLRSVNYVEITNDLRLVHSDLELQSDSLDYYKSRENLFYSRNFSEIQYRQQQLSVRQKMMLEEIKSIFIKHKTDYKILITPLYDQIKLHKNDSLYLHSIFDNIYDYSGQNSITNNRYNFYEDSHFKPYVGRIILSEINK